MTRYSLAVGLAVLGGSTAFATIVAPVPRLAEWKVPGAPKPETPGEMEEPAKILERLTQNTKDIGDRLKDQDTGDETRKKQEQALKDIDALLKQNEPPPMDGGGGGGASEMPPPPMPGGGNSGMKPPPPMGGMGQPMPMPMGGGRPKRGDKPMPMPMGPGMKDPMMQPGGMKDPMGTGMKEPMMQPGGMKETGMNPAGGTKSNSPPPSLPNEDPFTKQVWGHLPEKLRQQASQYYREQYMPKYQEMLKQYYSNLAERDRPAKK